MDNGSYQKQCPECGEMVDGLAKFCSECGERFPLPEPVVYGPNSNARILSPAEMNAIALEALNANLKITVKF